MLTLIEIEEGFNRLQSYLSSSISKRVKFELLCRFLTDLEDYPQRSVLRSYYLQLWPHLLLLITDETLEYRSPEFLENLLLSMGTVAAICGEEIESEEIAALKGVISRALCTVYLFLGEWEKAVGIVSKGVELQWSELKERLSTEQHILERLQVLIAALATGYPEIAGPLDAIYERIRLFFPTENEDYVNILLIESLGINHEDVSNGTIQPLSLRLRHRSAELEGDLLFFNYREEPYNELMYNQAQDAWHWVKSQFLSGKQQKKNPKWYRLEFVFPVKESFYTGDSLGLGMGLLNYSVLSKFEAQRYEYHLRDDFVITGRMDRNGNILPIAAKALEKKLETFFFSPFSVVVVPEDNLKDAEKITAALSRTYPGKQFMLISASHVKHLIDRTELIRRVRTPLAKQLLKRNRIRSLVSAFLVFLILCLVYLIYPDIKDSNPTSLELNSGYLWAYNKDRQAVWSYRLDYYQEQTSFKVGRFLKKIADFNSDGRNEVVIGYSIVEQSVTARIIYLSSDGEKRWEYAEHPETVWGRNTYSTQYTLGDFYMHDLDNDHQAEIIAVFKHELYFPTRLVIFNLEGDVLGEYWNAGHIYDVKFMDVNNDSIDEIIFGGTNNEYNRAFLGVLDLYHVRGHSPQLKAEYTIQNAGKGEEVYYLLFPDIGYLINEYDRASVKDIALHKNWIKLSILNQGNLCYFSLLNASFQVLQSFLTDATLAYYQRIKGRNIFEEVSRDSLKKLLSEISYWNGETWVDTVAMSRKW